MLLRSFETVAHYIAGPTTAMGLHATTVLKRGGNELSERVSTEDWLCLRLQMKLHAVRPQRDYTMRPQPRPR